MESERWVANVGSKFVDRHGHIPHTSNEAPDKNPASSNLETLTGQMTDIRR